MNKRIPAYRALLLGGVMVSMLWALYFALSTILLPYQIEYREGTAQVLTALFLKGHNPFILDNQPLAMNNYGLGYNLVVLPFAALFGNTLLVHRSVTFVFVLLSAAFCFLVVYQRKKDTLPALATAVFILTGLIAHAGIGAFPSALGVFLFLLAVFIPFLRSFDVPGLLIGALACLMAFYTKPYFLLAFAIVSSFTFLFISKRRGVLYVLAFSAAFVLCGLLVSRVFPLYFINTVMSNISNTYRTTEHLLLQLKQLFLYFYPVLFLAGVALIWRRKEAATDRSAQTFEGSLLHNSPGDPLIHFSLYAFVCCLLAFLIILGPHIGNYMNYAYQLVVPTFFCWFFTRLTFKGRAQYIQALVILFTLFNWSAHVLSPQMLAQRESKEWARLFEYVHSSKVTLNSPLIAAEMVEHGQMPFDSGQTSYFYLVEPFSENVFLRSSYEAFSRDGDRYVFTIDRMIEKQKFDLVVLTEQKATFFHSKNLQNHYVLADEFAVEMPQTYQYWTVLVFKPLQQ